MQQNREKFASRSGAHEPTPRELEWRDTLRRYRESGLTVVAFCKRERFALSLFYYWKREIARRDLGLPKASSNGKPRPPRDSRFVPLKVCRVEIQQAPLELVLADNRRVRIGGDFDAGVLKKLLAVLEPAP
jgi:hypothetical protein